MYSAKLKIWMILSSPSALRLSTHARAQTSTTHKAIAPRLIVKTRSRSRMLSVLRGSLARQHVHGRTQPTHGLKPVLLPVKSKHSASVMAKSHTAFPPSAKAEMIWGR